LIKLGGELRQLHLLDGPLLSSTIVSYPEGGDNVISRKLTKISLGHDSINDTSDEERLMLTTFVIILILSVH